MDSGRMPSISAHAAATVSSSDPRGGWEASASRASAAAAAARTSGGRVCRSSFPVGVSGSDGRSSTRDGRPAGSSHR
eukprot:scaffold438_cov110-Isochrysis_galbana.AAC.6